MFRSGGRPKTYKCTCKSHCRTFNPSTGEYEGDGSIVSRNTRNNHRKDDKLLDAQQCATSPSQQSRFAFFQRRHSISPLGAESTGEQSSFSFFRRRQSTPPTDTHRPQTHRASASRGEQAANWLALVEQETQWLSEFPVTSPEAPLVFVNDPAASGGYTRPSPADIVRPNHGLYALVPGLRPNYAFLSTENRLCELINTLSTMETLEERNSLSDRLYDQLGRLAQEKEYSWAQQRAHLTPGTIVENTEMHFYKRGPRHIFSKAAALSSLAMELLYFTPRRALRVQLAGQKDVFRRLGGAADSLNSIPQDPRSVDSYFRLNPVTRQFLSCPKCFCLYPYNPGDNPANTDSPVISQCNFKATPESLACEASLWKARQLGDGRMRFAPWRRYLHQVLKAWVGRLLSRPSIEDLLEKCQHAVQMDQDGPIPDIWFSKIFQGLRGPDGNLFFPGPPGEGRLVFSLSVDSFNPFHMKTAKQTVSSTGIWLVLLNLPPHLRYLPENVFLVGVLPDKPSTFQLNHALTLVVKDLLEFWDPGVFFTRTHKRRAGKHVRAMLVPLVCDMLAARQVLGLPGTTTAHSFCTRCDLDIDDIEVLDQSEWPKKDVNHIREFANHWKQASSEAFQNNIFDACGLRWSALLDLPYWNPVLYAVIDSMHALDLGLFQHHLRRLFRIDMGVKTSGDGASEPRPPADKTLTSPDDKRDLRKCLTLLSEDPPRSKLLYELLQFARKILYTVCVENDIKGAGHNLVVGTRWVLAYNIFHWRLSGDYDAGKLWNSPILHAVSQRPMPAPDVAASGPAPVALPEPENDEINISLAKRIITHLTNAEDPEEGMRKAKDQGTVVVFAYLCRILGTDYSSIELNRRGAKGKLFELLQEAMNDPAKLSQLGAYIPVKSPNRIVLGEDIMKIIWTDMERTQLPTWIRPAPPNWGTTQRGKLSADQYRVICTIHLVVTLVRLWGRDTGRKKEMLKHFMDLVNAVRIANLRVTSRRKIEAYNKFIFCYAERCITLFPDENLKPHLHAALHMGDIMDLFGPVHAYSAPFFERYINFFHRINTNQKIGELEATFMQVSARASNLRCLLSENEDLRATAKGLIQAIEAAGREDARGYRLASLLDPTAADYVIDSNAVPFDLPEEIFQRLRVIISGGSDRQLQIPRQALSINRISTGGVTYGTSTSSTFKDSKIVFQRLINDTDEELTAGCIQNIFQHTHGVAGETERVAEFYLVVQEFSPVDPASDPYREFGFSGGFLCERGPAHAFRVIKLSQVVSHCALTPIEDGDHAGLIHVLPLDRLMLSFRISSGDAGEADNEEH